VKEIDYSAAAIKDLEQIGDYIAERLYNPQAAFNTVNKIQDAIDKLADFPLMGSSLSSITGIKTDYRFLVCGNYLVFYRPLENKTLIIRIIYGRRDYIGILFGNIRRDDE